MRSRKLRVDFKKSPVISLWCWLLHQASSSAYCKAQHILEHHAWNYEEESTFKPFTVLPSYKGERGTVICIFHLDLRFGGLLKAKGESGTALNFNSGPQFPDHNIISPPCCRVYTSWSPLLPWRVAMAQLEEEITQWISFSSQLPDKLL